MRRASPSRTRTTPRQRFERLPIELAQRVALRFLKNAITSPFASGTRSISPPSGAFAPMRPSDFCSSASSHSIPSARAWAPTARSAMRRAFFGSSSR